MVNSELPQDLIDAGAELVTLLDKEGVQPDAAFWLFDSDLNTWKLILVEAKVGKEGPKEAYRQIQKYISKLPAEYRDHLSLEDVAITKPDSLPVRLLKMAIKTGSGVSGIRFKNSVINGMPIEDAYIYRLT